MGITILGNLYILVLYFKWLKPECRSKTEQFVFVFEAVFEFVFVFVFGFVYVFVFEFEFVFVFEVCQT